jgi:hypothetical protein
MASIRFNEWKFRQDKEFVWIEKFDKGMGMFEALQKFTPQQLKDYADQVKKHTDADFTFTHNRQTYTVEKNIIAHAVSWIKAFEKEEV